MGGVIGVIQELGEIGVIWGQMHVNSTVPLALGALGRRKGFTPSDSELCATPSKKKTCFLKLALVLLSFASFGKRFHQVQICAKIYTNVVKLTT